MTTPDDPGQPGNEAPPPGYAAPSPGHAAPSPGYGAAPPEYGAPPPGYAAPPAGYGAPPPQYGTPAPYGAAPPGYGAAPQGQLADWILRVGAYLIDSLIAAAIYFVGFLLASIVSNGSNGLAVLFLIAGVIGSLAFTIWNLVRQGNTGQTIGKTQLKLRLVRESDGQFVGAGMSILRALAHIVDSLACYIGWLWPLWDAKKQTFADKIVQTLVVKV